MKRCADCKLVEDTQDEPGEDPIYRCACLTPFWVPVIIHDYKSWVGADDGAKCPAFQPAEK